MIKPDGSSPKTNRAQEPWVRMGYELFAQAGPAGLKVEVMARRVGKSKSSFYHHFADLEVFTEVLLHRHLERAHVIAEQERQCPRVIPDLLNVLVTVKPDLLFNRQLRVHRHVPEFKRCFERSSQIVSEAIMGIWAEALGLSHNSDVAGMVLTLSLENFYLQITEETLTYDWLVDYVERLQAMVNAFGRLPGSAMVVR